MNARVRSEPFAHSRCFVCAEVVQDDMQILTSTDAPIQQLEEGQELLAIGLVRNLANHFARQRIECSVQSCSTVPFIVMGATANATWIQRQTRLSAVQCLNLCFLINAEHHGVVGWAHV